MRQVTQLILLIVGMVFACTPALAAESGPRGELWGPLPTDYWIAILLAAGFVLMIAEIKVISYGIMGLAGSACLLAAMFIMVRYQQDFYGIPPMYLVPVIIAMMIICGALGFLGARTRDIAVASGAESFVGQEAKVIQDLAPAGKVLFQGSYWDAVSSRPVTAGAMVKIVSAENMRLTVEPTE